jgi:signal transduction histidine kinase/ActR/RegA family two-component response regulator
MEGEAGPGRFNPVAALRDGLWATARGRLVALTLVVTVAAIFATALTLWDALRHERQAVERQLNETARALSLVVDRRLGQDQAVVEALATSPYLLEGDFRAFDAQARRAIRRPSTWVTVISPDDRLVVNTRRPYGSPPVQIRRRTSALAGPTRNGRDVTVSNLIYSPTSNSYIVFVTTELDTDKGPLRLSVVSEAASLQEILRDQRLPDGWKGTIIDGNGAIVARNVIGPGIIARRAGGEIRARFEAGRDGVFESTTLESTPTLTALSKAPTYGWGFLVSMPRSELVASARRSLILAVAASTALLAGGLLLAGLLGASIARPIERLAAAAGALGRGERIAVKPTGIQEIDAVGAAMAEASETLSDREHELRALNETLEHRVQERTRELHETHESLLQAQKLEAVGRLTGGIAHDFNNLLTAVQGNLELIARRTEDPRLAPLIANARQASERGARLTQQLLAFSRRQRLEPQPTDINGAIDAAARLLRSTLGGVLQIEVQPTPDLWAAMADATQLELILLNLAINAKDAMVETEGGAIAIKAANIELAAPPTRPESPPPGRYVAISVIDNGSGMPPEVLDRVFEPFFTTKEIGRGSGLGLPQVLGVVKQLGGGVEIVTAPGEGATVTIFLPKAESAVVAEEVSPTAPVALKGVRILLVDDDPDVRGVAAAMLADLGCRVTQAAGGQAALDVLGVGTEFDLALLDYAMPGLNGGETAQRIAARWPDLPVLLMSGFADAEALAAAWSGPMLHKPFGAGVLSAQVAAALAARRPAPRAANA